MASVVQALAKVKGIASTTVTSSSTDWTSNVAGGNTIIVAVWASNSIAVLINSVTDSNGNIYTEDIVEDVTSSSVGYEVKIYRSYNVVGGNKPTLTVDASSGSRIVFSAIEVSGLVNNGQIATTSNFATLATTTPDANSQSTPTTNALVVTAVVLKQDATNSFTNEPTGFTSFVQETDDTSPNVPGDGAWRLFASVSTSNPVWTIGTAKPFAAVQAAYEAITSSPGLGLTGARMLLGGTKRFNKRQLGV